MKEMKFKAAASYGTSVVALENVRELPRCAVIAVIFYCRFVQAIAVSDSRNHVSIRPVWNARYPIPFEWIAIDEHADDVDADVRRYHPESIAVRIALEIITRGTLV